MYEPIYDIQIFGEYSLESSKIALFPVKSRQRIKIPLSVRDAKTSDCVEK